MSNDTPTGPPDKEPDGAPDDTRPDETPTEIQDAAVQDAADDDAPDRSPEDGPSDSAADGTPTERFAPGLDDDATKILPVGGQPVVGAHVPIAPVPPAASAETTPVTPATPPGGTVPPKKNRALLYWLIGIGAALLVAVIVLLVLLFSGGGDEPEPTAEPTPSATPTEQPTPSAEPTQEPTPTPEPTQAPAGPTFATFSAPTSANCAEDDDEAPLSFSWSSDDAVRAYLGVGTQNAAINPTVSDLPPTATYTDLAYDCGVASQVYTVTLEDEAGALASRTVTITR
jgi:hypothetical protein